MNAPLTKEQLALLSSDTVTYRATPVQGVGAAPKPSIFAVLADATRWVLELPRRRAVLDELSRLTDRELNDIGLVRADLKQVFARNR